MQEGAPLSPKALNELINNLRVFYHCPSCSAEYQTDDIRFLGKVDQHCFMQLNCQKCSLPVLATVFMSGNDIAVKTKRNRRKTGKSSLGMDASRRERAQFHRRGAITSAEIVDIYSFLNS